MFRYKHEKQPQAQGSNYLAELKLGLRYIGARSYLKIFFVSMSLYLFLVTPLAFLSPLLISRTFGEDALLLMWMEVCYSAGMILGGVVMSAWGGLRNRVHTMILSSLVTAVGCIVMGLPISYLAYLALFALGGLFSPAFNATAMVMLQERVDDEFRGRVFSVMNMIHGAALPLGMLVFGPLADIVSIQLLMLISGVLMLLSVFATMTRRPLLEAGEPKASAEEA